MSWEIIQQRVNSLNTLVAALVALTDGTLTEEQFEIFAQGPLEEIRNICDEFLGKSVEYATTTTTGRPADEQD